MRIINLSGRRVVINLDALRLRIDDDELAQIRELNPNLRIERTTEGIINFTGKREKEKRSDTQNLSWYKTE